MSPLFQPLEFRSGLVVKNRVTLAPLTNQQSHADGSLSEDELVWLRRRARGGFGVVTTCAAHVSVDGQGWPGELGVFDDRLLPGLTRLAQALRAEGAAAFVQIFHGGVRADTRASGLTAITSSAAEGARAATDEDLERVILDFGRAARRAEAAGFQGVELHGAHGYLLTQFLSVAQNQRTDQWGGSLENRARLLLRTFDEVRKQTSATFTVGLRLSPENFGNAKGLDLDESLQVARWLGERGVDFLHLSLWEALRNTTKRPSEHAIPLFKAALGGSIPVLVAGKIWTRAEAEHLLALGADAVALGRSAILNPEWPLLAESATFEPLRPPVSIDQLRALDLNASFAEYMRNWPGFVV
jgi:2,4-dienoyl-CoA reductase-like NADH-dependent reductase (Old Yellow Enzyme family)